MKQRPLLFNRTSLLAAAVAFVSLLATIFLAIPHLTFANGGSWSQLFAWIVFPTVFWASLVVLVVGALREWRHRHQAHPEMVPGRLRIDVTRAGVRRKVLIGVPILAVLLTWGSFTAFHAYEYTESTAFCASTCHTVMAPERITHQISPHASVTCAQCHVGHTPAQYVEAKVFGLKELYWLVTDTYQRPIKTPIRAMQPVRENCESCHWGGKYWGKMHRDYSHYISSEDNRQWTVKMNVKVGGTYRFGGEGEGIHWHMRLAPRVYYTATDERLQNVPWIKVVREDGQEVVYTDPDAKFTEQDLTTSEIREMTCVDCHNRPAHQFKAPILAIDDAIARGHIDPDIPEIKDKAAELLASRQYQTQAEGAGSVGRQLIAYYREESPDVYQKKKRKIEEAAEALSTIYSQNFFPEMKADWRAYPDNIGHFLSDGCFRCHDGRHQTEDGSTLSNDCSLCHDIVVQGPPEELESDANGLEFRHPVDFGAPASELGKCTECHDGALGHSE